MYEIKLEAERSRKRRTKLKIRYFEENEKILISMLDAVYIDTKNNLIIAIKPKLPFRPVFKVAASCEGSDIRIIN